MSELSTPAEAIVMQTGARPLAEPRRLIQIAFDADMETLGVVAESQKIKELHRRLILGEISKDIFLEAVREMLEAAR